MSLLDSVINKNQITEVNDQLIIDCLKAVTLEPQHIDEIIELIGPSQVNLTRVKIQLFESKSDFVEAFMLHLNNDNLRKVLFKWLFETLEKLTKIDN